MSVHLSMKDVTYPGFCWCNLHFRQPENHADKLTAEASKATCPVCKRLFLEHLTKELVRT